MLKLRSILLFASLFLLAGCQAHFAILNPKGVIAATERKVFIDSVCLMLLVVIPVIILSFVIPWRYRANNAKAKYSPNWAHSNLLELIWWGIPCVIIAILGVMAWNYTHSLDPYRPIAADSDTVMIEAIALDWKWLFIYPRDHIASVNEVTIPVNKPVRFYIASDAPMNSLEIPQLAGQVYAMTGMQTKLNLMATHTGVYRGLSTNFSGNGFSGMHFTVHVVSQEDYGTWVNQVQHSPNKLTMDAYNQLVVPSSNNPVEYFSDTAKGLFKNSIIKWMGPMPGMTLGYTRPSLEK